MAARRTPLPFFMVNVPKGREPEMYLADRLDTAPRNEPTAFLALPRPQDPRPERELLLQRMWMPMDPRTMPHMVDLDVAGLRAVWFDDVDTGLSVPAEVREELILDRLIPHTTIITPTEVGIPVTSAIATSLAWKVLVRVIPEGVAFFAGGWATRTEAFGLGRIDGVGERLVDALGLSPALANRCLGEVHSGRPMFDPRCLRWLICEASAGVTSGRWAPPDELPTLSADEELFARAFFPSVQSGCQPSRFEVLRAIWFLHEGFHMRPARAEDEDVEPLTLLTTLGYENTLNHPWLEVLDRWDIAWNIDDTNPSMANASPLPSEVRSNFEERAGVTISEWLAGMNMVASHMFMQAIRHGIMLMHVDALERPGQDMHVDPRLVQALRQNAIATLAELGAEVLRDNPSYSGVGTTSHADSLPLRNRPIVQIHDLLVPASISLIARRAVHLPRLLPHVSYGARQRLGTMGLMLEAYALGLLDGLTDRHHVIGPTALKAYTAGGSHADAVVSIGGDYLLIEVSLQTLSRKVVAGDRNAIVKLCEQYHDELDQAVATAQSLRFIAQGEGWLAPRRSGVLLVVDDALTHSPALLGELSRQRPNRSPLFLCSIRELEELVRLSARWDAPGLVLSWQNGGVYRSLGEHLARAGRWHRPPAAERETDWVSLLPLVA